MQKQITFKNINEDTFFTEQFWKKFKQEFEGWLENFSLELKKIYPQKLKNLSQDEIADYLYVPACRDYLNKYQNIIGSKSFLEKISMFKHNLSKSTFVRVDRYLDEQEFSKNVKLRALEEYRLLQDKLNHYEKRNDIEKVIIVSHTLPFPEFAKSISTEFNSMFFNIKSK